MSRRMIRRVVFVALVLVTSACASPSTLPSTLLPQAPLLPRERVAAAWLGSGMIVVGGAQRSKTGAAVFGDVARYSPGTRSWLPLPAFPLGPRQGAMAVGRLGALMVWGGESACGGDSCPSRRTGAVLDLKTGQWRTFDAGVAVEGMSDGVMLSSCGRVYAGAGGEGQGTSRISRVVTGPWAGQGWRTVPLQDPVYDIAADETSVYVVTVDAQQRAVVHVLDACTGEELRQLPQPDELRVTGVWLEVVAGRVHVARSDARRVRVETLSYDGWTPLADLSADDMPMPQSVPSLHGWSGTAGSYVFGVTALGLWRFDVRTGKVRAIDTPADPCGAGAAAVMGPSDLLVWGGQRCDGSEDVQTSSGLSVALS